MEQRMAGKIRMAPGTAGNITVSGNMTGLDPGIPSKLQNLCLC